MSTFELNDANHGKENTKHEKSCGCIIIREKKVLLIAGFDPDDNALFWSFPKGRQKSGETDFETALRETREEIGLEVIVTDPRPIVTTHLTKQGTVEKMVLLFLARLTDPQAKPTFQPEEVAVAEWLDFDEADQRLTNVEFADGDFYRVAWEEARTRIEAEK